MVFFNHNATSLPPLSTVFKCCGVKGTGSKPAAVYKHSPAAAKRLRGPLAG